MTATLSHIRQVLQHRGARKGQNGRVLILGGSSQYVGAPALAGLAALHSGVDLVTIVAPEKVAWAINAISPDLITQKLTGDDFSKRHFRDIEKLIEKNDVVLIGNGLSPKASTLYKLFVHDILKPLVLDAGILRVLRLQEVENSILTPHRDELRSLLINSGYKQYTDVISSPEEGRLRRGDVMSTKLLDFIQQIVGTNVLLLKGPIDYIISHTKIAQNKTGNTGMTKGGTGDTLAGLCAGFLAQIGNPFESACYAAYINGLAGDILLKRKKGYTFLASDIAKEIEKILLPL